MSDSESDTSNNVFNFQNFNTTVSARGPNTNCSFRNPISSTMHMSRNFERPRYAESVYDQRSIYYRRETSPMSIQSACDMRQRNFQHYTGMSSRQSVFSGRGGSPMSMRSIGSSVSVSAADIAFAFNNGKFNRNDWKLIREAYQKVLKQRVRKRIEKRRKKRLHLKSRRRSGDDSGDQASDSSVSSDDHRSVKTYNENMSSSRSTRIDLTDFRNTYRDRNMPKDGLDNFSQNTFKNKFSVGTNSINGTQNLNNTGISNQLNSMRSQKDRFRNGFLLPSQRFNRSVASSVIMEHSGKPHKNTRNNMRNNCQSEEEIFSERTVREKSTFDIAPQRKRSLDSDDESRLPDSKRSRVAPGKNNTRAPPTLKKINPSNSVDLSNSFQFAKPSMPVRKSKNKVQEQLIAKSSQPLTGFLEPMPNQIQEKVQALDTTNSKEKSNDNLTVDQSQDTTQNSDVSSRPSFIKRKLFTQNLDVAEKANLNTDATNSPQSSVYTLQKEKNKARKLVTNQSCLNREVQDDNNLLDLIHKIVPPDRINLSNQTTINQTKNDVNNKKDNKRKWDVSSVISMCNEDDASDTYTDEEIFKADKTVKHTTKDKDINTKANPVDKVVSKTIIPQYSCKLVMKKLDNINILQKQIVNQNFTVTHNNNTKNNATNSVKTFWDTDFESDAECHIVLPRNHVLDNLMKANAILDTKKQDFKKPAGLVETENSKKSLTTAEVPKQLNNSLMNNTTFNNTLKLNANILSVRSHRTSKKNKCFNETCTSETVSKPEIPVDKKKNNSKQPVKNNVGTTKSKDNVQNKHPTDVSKSKLNTENENDSTNVTSQSPKSKKKSKSKVEKSSSVNNQNSIPEPQNNKTLTKRKAENLKENTQVEKACKNYHKDKPQRENQHNKEQTSPKSKPKPKQSENKKQSKKKKPVLQPNNSILNNTVESVQNISFTSGRPVRSCRTSSQNRSQLNNTSVDMNKSLRSRVINLSSSIENITIKIKHKNKNNRNISQMITRKSDVSFSLRSREQTPVSKKNSARSRADQRKRKT